MEEKNEDKNERNNEIKKERMPNIQYALRLPHAIAGVLEVGRKGDPPVHFLRRIKKISNKSCI